MSTEKIYYEGNVGIGTQNPQLPLQVIGDISAGHSWEGGNNTTGVKIGKPDGEGKWAAGSAFLQFQDSKTDGVNKGTSLSVHTHEWGGGTKEALRVAANGNVGVGKPDPHYKLDVYGEARVANPSGRTLMLERDNEDSWLTFHDPGNAWYSMGLDVSDGRKFKLNYGGSLSEKGANHFTMLTDGRIGIGTSNPAHTLDVNGTINAKQVLVNGQPLSAGGGGGATDHIGLRQHGGDGKVSTFITFHNDGFGATQESSLLWINGPDRKAAAAISSQPGGNYDTGDLRFHTGKNGALGNRMIIDAEGRVGIGTASPSEKLEVSGNVKVGVGARRIIMKNGRNGDASLSVPSGWFRVNAGYDISFWTNGKGDTDDLPQVRFDNKGNILCQGTLAQNSDGRLKKAIQPIARALDKITGLRGVNYLWKDASRGNDTQMGLIAQEVEAVLPEAVCMDAAGTKSIAYGNLTAVLIEAVKEQQKQIESLKEKFAQFTMAT